MAKRKRAKNKLVKDEIEQVDPNVPRSMVIRMGRVGKYVKILKKNMRTVMSPNTALKLKESNANRLKDFKDLAVDYKVSHFMVFTQTDLATWLRIARHPQGPTLTFRVAGYSTMEDITRLQKRPMSTESGKTSQPLLIMNGFPTDVPHLNLTTVLLQSMFPPLVIRDVKLQNCRRVVMFSYNAENDTIDLRHYYIKVAGVGVTRSIKNVVRKDRKKIPNLSKYKDISEYVLKNNADGSDSEMEDGPDNRINLDTQYSRKHLAQAPQSAIRLVELGPRLSLQLVKIQEGFLDGKVLYHAYVSKTPEEIADLEKRLQETRKLKEIRKKEQAANIKKKQKEKDEQDMEDQKQEDAQYVEEEAEHSDDGLEEEAKYYKEEVGEEIDPNELKDFKEEKPKVKFNPLMNKKKQKKKAKFSN